MLEQLVALLYLGDDSFYIGCECLAFEQDQGNATVVAATGRFSDSIGKKPADSLDSHVFQLINEAHSQKKSILRNKEFIGYFEPHTGREDVIYVNSPQV